MKNILPDATKLFPLRASVALPLSNAFNESKMGPKGRNKQTNKQNNEKRLLRPFIPKTSRKLKPKFLFVFEYLQAA